jgi:uncharacterized membrane protein YesL
MQICTHLLNTQVRRNFGVKVRTRLKKPICFADHRSNYWKMQYKLLVSIFWSKRLVTCFVLNTVDGICVITLLVFMHLFDGPCCSSFNFFCFFLLCVFTFCISCDVSYDFRIKTMFGSSLPPVVYRRDNVLFMLFVLVCVYWYHRHIVLCFSSSCRVYPMQHVSLYCPFLIAPSVFSIVYYLHLRDNMFMN